MSGAAATLIATLGLAAHPEGGWYRETWRVPAPGGGRDLATAILFLLEAGGRSHWHRIDADELWIWQAGAPLLLSIVEDGGKATELRLGADAVAGEQPQGRVPARAWQAAVPAGDGWTLVSCIVSPAFDFARFELAPGGWSPPCR